MAELVCEIHGPYDASLGRCPHPDHGSGPLPSDPPPLSADYEITDLGGSGSAGGAGTTEIGEGGGGFDVDLTQLGKASGGLDHTVLDTVDSGVKGLLLHKEGIHKMLGWHLKDGTVVGRTMGDIPLPDEKVSNPHIRFRIEDDKFVLWNCGAVNPPEVNGKPVRTPKKLKENDEIKIGDELFVLKTLG